MIESLHRVSSLLAIRKFPAYLFNLYFRCYSQLERFGRPQKRKAMDLDSDGDVDMEVFIFISIVL